MKIAIANRVPQGTPYFLDHVFSGKAQDVIAMGLELHQEIKRGTVYSPQCAGRIGDLRFRLLTTAIFWSADRDLAAIPAWQSVVQELKQPAIAYRGGDEELFTEETLQRALSLPAPDTHRPVAADRMETIKLVHLALQTASPVLAFRYHMDASLAESEKWSSKTRARSREKINILASGDLQNLPESILGASDKNIVLGGFYAYLVLFQTCGSIQELCDLVSLGQKFAERYPQFKPPLEKLTASRCTRLPDSAALSFSHQSFI